MDAFQMGAVRLTRDRLGTTCTEVSMVENLARRVFELPGEVEYDYDRNQIFQQMRRHLRQGAEAARSCYQGLLPYLPASHRDETAGTDKERLEARFYNLWQDLLGRADRACRNVATTLGWINFNQAVFLAGGREPGSQFDNLVRHAQDVRASLSEMRRGPRQVRRDGRGGLTGDRPHTGQPPPRPPPGPGPSSGGTLPLPPIQDSSSKGGMNMTRAINLPCFQWRMAAY